MKACLAGGKEKHCRGKERWCFVSRVKKFFHFPWDEQRLLLTVFILTGLIRAAIVLLPFKWLASFLGKCQTESPANVAVDNDKQAKLRRVSWAIRVMSRYTPWDSKCLVQAITGKVLLRRLRLSSTLYLGVGRDEQNPLMAHAWLRCGDMMVTGGAGRERFTIVGSFADEAE